MKQDIYIPVRCLSLEKTLFSGQSFRWEKKDEHLFFGISGRKELFVRQEENGITLLSVDEEDVPYWYHYFDLGTDYDAILNRFQDETLKKTIQIHYGLRILRQQPYETLITFILSQNNNMKRIRGLVSRLCETWGEPLSNGYAFPSPLKLYQLTEEDFAPVRAGFRTKYLIDATNKVVLRDVDLYGISSLSYEEGKKELLKIRGVGEKVADCVLLFGFYKMEAFPKDVWIKRALARYYPNGLPKSVIPYAGIAQQYLFEYIRSCEEKESLPTF